MRPWTAIGFVFLAIASGCDRPKVQTTASTPSAPTTAPDQPITALAPPATEPAEVVDNGPANCVMMIDRHRMEFPPALIRISQKEGRVQALLYSDDPKAALNDSYQGNGFYFKLGLDVADTQFEEATWTHRSQSSERVDTPYGIFLAGHRRQLQPLDVRMRLLPAAGGGMKIEMAGTFLSVDPQDEMAPTQVITAAAWLLAEKR